MKIKLSAVKKTVPIHTPFIRMDELLKFVHAVMSGGEAKEVIQKGEVQYNGQVCTMRGKKIYPGDQVVFHGITYEVAAL